MDSMESEVLEKDTVIDSKSFNRTQRSVSALGISFILLVGAGVLLAVDFADVLFSHSRQQQALALIKPGMRLTQAERVLNGAGYLTLYVEQRPPVLEVSALRRRPATTQLLHKLFPHSTADIWMMYRLSERTRFYIHSEPDGTVNFTRDGKVATSAYNQAAAERSSSF